MEGTDRTLDSSIVSFIAASARQSLLCSADDVARLKTAVSTDRVTRARLGEICNDVGISYRFVRFSLKQLSGKVSLPIVAIDRSGSPFLITGLGPPNSRKQRIDVVEPDGSAVRAATTTFGVLQHRWDGTCVSLRRKLTNDSGRSSGVLTYGFRIRSDFGLLVQIAAMVGIVSALAVIPPLFFQAITNRVLPYDARATLETIVVVAVCALIIHAFGSFLRGYFVSILGSRFEMRLDDALIVKLLGLPVGFFEQRPTGTLVQQIMQLHVIKQFLIGNALPATLDLGIVCVALPCLSYISIELTKVVVLFAVTIAIVVGLSSSMYKADVESMMKDEGRRQSVLVETIKGIATIKALTAENAVAATWRERSSSIVRRSGALATRISASNAILALLERLSTIAVLAFGTTLVLGQHLTLGSLIAVQMLTGTLIAPLSRFAALASDFQRFRKATGLLDEVFAAANERPSEANRFRVSTLERFEFRSVTFAYPATRSVLSNVSFVAEPSRILAVVGGSGSGKSTLVRLLQGFIRPSSGNVLVGGVDLGELDLTWFRKNVGIVSQRNFLFRGSIAENIAFGSPGASSEQIVGAARAAHALRFILELPAGFATTVEEDGANLSGGQQQRVAIARALVRNPKILIFDEPTSALDADAERAIIAEINRLRPHRTIVIVTHRSFPLTIADDVLVLEDGRVTAYGPKACVETSGAFGRLFPTSAVGAQMGDGSV